MSSTHRRQVSALIALTSLVLILPLLLLILSPSKVTTAQPRATNAAGTADALRGNARGTADAIATNAVATADAIRQGAQGTANAIGTNAVGTVASISDTVRGTAQARATNAVATLQFRSDNLIATAQALQTNAVGTLQGVATNAVATVHYVATTVNGNVDDLRLTATAIAINWEDALNPEMAAILDDLTENSTVTYDAARDALVVTTYIDESAANTEIDAILIAAGADPNTVTLDAGGGQVTLTLVNAETGQTLTLGYSLVVVDGVVVPLLEAATFNGSAVPLESVPDAFITAAENTLLGAVILPAIDAVTPNYTGTVESVIIGEAGVLVIWVITAVE